MMRHNALWLCLFPLLTGCGVLGWNDKPETLADLKGRRVDVVQAPVHGATRERAMANYREFLGTDGDETLRPEAMRRLADLQLEEHEYRLAELPDSAAVDPMASDPAESVALYETVLRDYPQYAHRDKALYQLARAHDDAGRGEVVLATLDRLVREHPDTPLRAEAEFRRGEILFVQSRYREAESAYQAVLDRGDGSDFYERALYKLGWARFKQNFYDEAMDAFIALLDRRLAGGTAAVAAMGRAERELLDDSLRVVSLSVSYQEGAASLDDYFRRRGERDYEDLIYANLGELYLDKERYSDAADVFHAYVERHPLARPAPIFQARVIDAYQRGGFPTLVLSAKRDFVERYALTGPYWQRHAQADVPEVVAALKTNLQDLARHHHAVAQQSRQAADYTEAARWYRAYIASFPQTDETPRMNFLLAETLFESQAYALAAEEYAKTAYDYPRHAHSAEAGYAALLAFDKHTAVLDAEQRAAWQRRAIDSALKFSATYAEHPQAMAVLTKAAEELFRLGEFAAAAQAASQVAERADNPHELRRTAWTVVAHASFDLADYERAEAAYQQTLALVPAQENGRQDLVERLAAAIYRQGEQARAQGDLTAAAAHFARVRTNAPAAEIVATADYDATAALLELRDWPNAIAQLEAFRRHHPGHALQADVTRKLAVAYLEGGRTQQAAAEFVRVADASQDPRLQREALWQAAELYQQSQQGALAVQTWGDYVQRFPQPLEPATEARQHIADLHAAAGAQSARLATLTELMQREAAAPAAERSERTRYLAAKAALEIAAPVLEDYRRIALKAPLKKHLDSKKRQLELAIAAHTRAADYGVAEVTTAATYHIAEIYRHFGQALLESERPGNLSADEAEQYVLLLEEQAFPFEEQAIAIHETNVARIPQGIYDDWVRQSLQQLAQLMPARYAKQERGEDHVAEIR
jgi:cellulose synthase operon protein C